MKKQKTFFVNYKNWLTVLSLLVLFSSALILLLQFGRSGTHTKNMGSLCLFIGTQLLLAGIVLFHGQEFFFHLEDKRFHSCLSDGDDNSL